MVGYCRYWLDLHRLKILKLRRCCLLTYYILNNHSNQSLCFNENYDPFLIFYCFLFCILYIYIGKVSYNIIFILCIYVDGYVC